MGQFGNRVSAAQYVRHGSAERGLPSFRRQRSRDGRGRETTNSCPPLQQGARPYGELQEAEWADVITDLKEKIKYLEGSQLRQSSDIGKLRTEFVAYKDMMKQDLSSVLFNNEDSLNKRLDKLQAATTTVENQLLNDVPMAISSSTAHIDRRIGEIEAAINAIVSEVIDRASAAHHDLATPVRGAIVSEVVVEPRPPDNERGVGSRDPWAAYATANPSQQRQPQQPQQPQQEPQRPQYGPPLAMESSPFEQGPAPTMPATFIDQPSVFEQPHSPRPHARTMGSPIYGPGGPGWNGPHPGGAGIPADYQIRGPQAPMRPASMEICRKKNDSLKKFSGTLSEYQLWRERIVDHLSRGNRSWRKLCDALQVCPAPITKFWLQSQSECGYNGWDLAEMLEGFLVEHMSDSLYRRRKQLSGGERGNGFEMWRWLYNEFQGGSDAVNLGGARRLQDWSRCTKMENLCQHLDDWVECLETHCTDLLHAPGTLRSMILGIIPQDLEDELLSKPNVKTWQEIVSWCKVKTVYRRQKVLSEQARKPGGRIASLIVEHEDGAEAPLGPTPAESLVGSSTPPSWFQDFINAMRKENTRKKGDGKGSGNVANAKAKGKGKGKGIRIHFEGCWHCGDKLHSRGKCPAFQKLMAEANKGISDRNEWKLPVGYSGKYEEAKKRARAKARVNALDGPSADGEYTEDEWEPSDDDQDVMGPGSNGRVFALRTQSKMPCTCCPLLAVDGEDDDLLCGTCQDEEEEDVGPTIDESQESEELVRELSRWAHRTIIKLKDPKKQSASQCIVSSVSRLEKMLRSHPDIARIASMSKDKTIERLRETIPGLPPCAADEIWALVDSGSTLNAADVEKHFPEYMKFILESKAQARGEVATTAGGHELRHEGKFRVDATIDGVHFPVPFTNMKVDIPILSVRKAVKHGSNVTFTEHGGTIVNRATGVTLTFIEANGSYWIKMKVLPPSAKDWLLTSKNEPVFTRPEP